MVVDIVDFEEVRWNVLALFDGRFWWMNEGVLRDDESQCKAQYRRGSRHAVPEGLRFKG